jgi:hypothetical protein
MATIVESGNRRFWGWHELFFVAFFWLLFFLRTWNQNFFFHFRAGKFSSAAPTNVAHDVLHWAMCSVLQRWIAKAIKTASEGGAFVCPCRFVVANNLS